MSRTSSASTASEAAPSTPCPFCKATKAHVRWITLDQEHELSRVVRCDSCHTSYLDPMPDAERLAKAYATTYYGGDTAAKFGGCAEWIRDQFAKVRARRLTRGLDRQACILDVGCGDGRFLRSCQRIGAAFELHGIELPGPVAARAAKVEGVVLHLGTLDSSELPDRSFDLITLVHVFEHLSNPDAAVMRLSKLLKPGGRLFISYPNGESWQAAVGGGDWFHLDPPRHLALVPPASLERRLSSLGVARAAVSHLSWEQNIYGWLQSILNKLPAKRNLLYEQIKRNHAYTKGHSGTVVIHALIAAGLFPFAVATDILASVFRRGATIELSFTKNNS